MSIDQVHATGAAPFSDTASSTVAASMRPSEVTARIALSLITEPGDRDIADLVESDGGEDLLRRILDSEDEHTARARRFARARLADRPVETLVDDALRRAEACGARVLTPHDPQWPVEVADLAELYDEADLLTAPPLCLWVRGEASIAELTRRSVSIVGARECSPYGHHVATEFGYDLAQSGWTVVSGGAFGIDAAAHRGALAGGGPTIAVLACGIDRAYPAGHISLFDEISVNGLVVSEWPPGSAPQRHRFLVRNRVIAALGQGVVVVEAALRSGARHTARRASELERPVMVVPGPINSRVSVGVHQLARSPGGARIVTRAAEIVEDLGRLGTDLAPPLIGATRPHDTLRPVEARVLDAVPATEAGSIAMIAAQAGVRPSEAAKALEGLARRGFVVGTDEGFTIAARPETHARRADQRGAAE